MMFEDIRRVVAALERRAQSDRRDELLGEFPLALAAGKVTNTWRSTAEGLYRNWLHYIQNEKERAAREMTHAAAG
jgi:homoserine trans-succinylase